MSNDMSISKSSDIISISDSNATDSKIDIIRNEINHVKDQVKDNIQLVIDRGEKLEDLEKKSEHLSKSSLLFKRQSKRLKCKMLKKNIKYTLALILIILIVIFVFLFSICGFNLQCGK